MSIEIKEAHINELPVMIEIYNKGIRQSIGSVLNTPFIDVIFNEYFSQVDHTFKIWVAVQDGNIVGWQSLLPNRINPVIRSVFAESIICVDPQYANSGIATQLLEHAINHAKTHKIHYIFGYIDTENTSAIKLVEKLGFTEVGKINGTEKASIPSQILYVHYLS
jgi:L-amino acid N-acyltransferase YncA